MAIDTIQKRESAFGICLPFTRVYPTADGSDADSEDERAHLVMNYNGIAIATAAGRIMSSLAWAGGLAHRGGIAGHGGGLAA